MITIPERLRGSSATFELALEHSPLVYLPQLQSSVVVQCSAFGAFGRSVFVALDLSL